VGSVREGFVADLALWDESPVDEPSALLRRPRAVYRAGVKVTRLRD